MVKKKLEFYPSRAPMPVLGGFQLGRVELSIVSDIEPQEPNIVRESASEHVVEPESAPARALRLPRQLSAFHHRNYQLFFFGQIISLTGTWLQGVAQPWLVLQLTNSALLLGIVGFVSSLPVLVLSLHAGVVVDRFSKRNVIIATQVSAMILAFALAILTYLHIVTIYHIIAIGFLLGVVNAFDAPARQSFVIEMVGREDLTNAIALNSAMFNGARMIGPTIASLVVAAVGIAGAFFVNAISYIAVIIGLLFMKVEHTAYAGRHSASGDLKEGLQYIKGDRLIMALLVLTGVVSIFATSYNVLMPIFARDILRGGLTGMAKLMTSVGAGALVGAIMISSLGDFKAKGKLLIVGNVIFCAMLVLFSYSRSLHLSMAILVLAGFGIMVNMGMTNTLIQISSPDHLRGRIVSAYTLMFLGMAPIGSLLAGTMAHYFGAPIAVRIGAIICGITALVISPTLAKHGNV